MNTAQTLAGPTGTIEYVVVIVPPQNGIRITPVTPEIQTIADEALVGDLGWIVNELAKLGFRLLDGTGDGH